MEKKTFGDVEEKKENTERHSYSQRDIRNRGTVSLHFHFSFFK